VQLKFKNRKWGVHVLCPKEKSTHDTTRSTDGEGTLQVPVGSCEKDWLGVNSSTLDLARYRAGTAGCKYVRIDMRYSSTAQYCIDVQF
jgi:hypothetical protein